MNFTEDANNLSAIQVGKPYIVKWSQQNARSFVLNLGGREQTGISTLPADAAPATDGICTLDGRRLSGMPTKSGLYIVNGKKVVTK